MTRQEKAEILLTTAKAFATRGPQLQYDQLSMDRALQITTRRRYTLPPEAATSQQRLYLDCATFVCAAFYNAFGYRLEADITWNMRDLVQDCIFRHNFTGEETDAEIDAMKAQVKALLEPGDAVVWSKPTNGHIMLYVDENTFYNCSQAGIPGSYDYTNRRDLVSEKGGMHIEDARWWFDETEDKVAGRNYLFNRAFVTLAVLRPLNRVGAPTPNALARMGSAKDLWMEVTTSHPGGRTAQSGEPVEYTFTVRNDRAEPAAVEVTFAAPAGSRLLSADSATLQLASGETAHRAFSVLTEESSALWLDAPVIMANGLHVYAPRILLGTNLTVPQAETLLQALNDAIAAGNDTETAVTEAYASLGITMPERRLLLRDLFHRYDSVQGEIFCRRVQDPKRDMAVYAYFGGTGVVTPEVGGNPFLRTTQLRMEDLQPGDILLASDDYTNHHIYEAVYTGEGFLGSYAPGQPPASLTGAAAAEYLDSLPGRFAYAILRPSMTL